MYCSKCGNELKEEEKSCSKCGKIIENKGIKNKYIKNSIVVILVIGSVFTVIMNYYDVISSNKQITKRTEDLINGNVKDTQQNQQYNLQDELAKMEEVEKGLDNIQGKYGLEDYTPPKRVAPGDNPQRDIAIADWNSIKVGMSYSEVVSILGYPTTTQKYPNGFENVLSSCEVLTYDFAHNGTYHSLYIIIETSSNLVIERENWK